jgi:phosphatidylserine/phosphatidylglycerophosphate/cardiolipin synthase-like enzyme
MIVDDVSLRVGSSNMNNRSMRLDTECDVTITTASPGNEGYGPVITGIRDGLIAEHLGCSQEQVRAKIDETDSLIATIESLRGTGKTLIPYETPDLTAVEEWLADNEVLDAEGPGAAIEGIVKGGLLRRLRRRKR